jgi:GNAT superfamily N-acetyltransferase
LIRLAKIEDSFRIAEIHICGWRFAYRGLISDNELFSKRQVHKSQINMQKKIEQGDRIWIFEDESDEIIKAFSWHGKSRDEDKKDAYEVYAIYVQPEFIRINVGSMLLKAIESQAIQEKYNEMILWVLDKNEKGKNFYFKNGYENDGIKKTIEDWNQVEIRMRKILTTAST